MMRLTRRRFVAAVAGSGFAISAGRSALAQPDPGGRFPEEDWNPDLLARLSCDPLYLPADFDTGLAPPPAAGDPAVLQELAALLDLQSSARTPAALERIRRESQTGTEVASLFIEAGLFPTDLHAPALGEFIQAVVDETAWFSLRDKQRFARLRPAQLEPRLKPAVSQPRCPGYPSGHASQAAAVIEALRVLDPNVPAGFLSLADRIGERRMIAGVSFASDIAAGRTLAKRVATAVAGIPQAKDLVAEARREYAEIPGAFIL